MLGLIVIVVLLGINIMRTKPYIIAINPKATFEEVEKDFDLDEQRSDGTQTAGYIEKFEDYKEDK